MYESPIRLLVQQMETSIREQQEKQIFEAIQKIGVDVDRDELIKALAYDRAQYAQGYSDGRADANRSTIVEERLPVVHGQWLRETIRPKSYLRVCSICEKTAYFCGEGCSYKYCPNCGTRMDGGA